jgi:hypothetical protein
MSARLFQRVADGVAEIEHRPLVLFRWIANHDLAFDVHAALQQLGR